jgi:hypothetical protein
VEEAIVVEVVALEVVLPVDWHLVTAEPVEMDMLQSCAINNLQGENV